MLNLTHFIIDVLYCRPKILVYVRWTFVNNRVLELTKTIFSWVNSLCFHYQAHTLIIESCFHICNSKPHSFKKLRENKLLWRPCKPPIKYKFFLLQLFFFNFLFIRLLASTGYCLLYHLFFVLFISDSVFGDIEIGLRILHFRNE